MITEQIFYRKYGVRLINQLISPPIFNLMDLNLPFKSIYHYLTFDGVEDGPPSDDYLFRNIKKPILVNNIFDVGDQLGNPRKQAINTNVAVRDYFNQNRRMRPLRNILLSSKDPNSLLVYNYCLINKTYKYVRSIFTEYYKWNNTFAAAMDAIKSTTAEVDSHHYLFTSPPKILPSLQQLELASNNDINQGILKVFNNKDSFFLLELWKWLSDKRSTSLFSRIPVSKMHLVNIIFQETGRWSVLNLGLINSFRINIDKEEGAILESHIQLEPIQIQKRLLKMVMVIMSSKTVTANVAVDEPPAETTQVVSVLTGNEVTVDETPTDSTINEITGNDETTNTPQEISAEIPIENIPSEDQATVVDDEEYIEEDKEAIKQKIIDDDAKLDEDLAFLNDITSKEEDLDLEKTTVQDIMDEPETSLEDSVMGICDTLADDGLLTANEYKRFTRLANTYKTLPSPDGKTTLDQFIKINPEDLKISESKTVVDNPTILDKSMLKSSLIDFDTRYIKTILPKDTAAMVMSVQKAGIAVTDYKVETVDDILGGYEMHTLKIAPVEGSQSTVRFKLPVVNETGSFSSGGIKYGFRKQRIDLPIRKVDYNRVALTSYYGKVFINRGRKKSDDYGYWLQTSVMEKGINKEDSDVTEIHPANVFDKEVKASRAYTALSMSFSSIKCRGFTLLFSRQTVLKTYPKPILKAFEKNGSIVIGSNANSNYLILDTNGTVYTTQNDNLKLFGTFEQFLGVPSQSAPVEYVDVVVFGKEVPIGVVLGYKIGFENLLKLLKVTPRRVNAGSRLNMEPGEYALAFSDETLLFNREDKLASLILAGFNEYHRALKMFSVYSFDKRGVYLNLLDSANLSVRYIREIDLMYNMFIDPITKDILVEMKEPVTFQGLLFRSCELLLDDIHPDELDPAFMRIRGYERFSGSVYTELVQSIRVHNGLLGKSNKPIEMNPYSVWKRISEDPSKSQISEINPIKQLKESEAVTLAGTGGRSKQSMVTSTRAYHKNDMGTISESTVDSSDVSINVFMSADPQFTSLRGISKRYDFNTTGATALLSTSALLAPGSDRDDPKRVNIWPL